MPVRFLSDAELVRLIGWPSEIADDDLVTFFTLTDDDLGCLGSNHRYENRLGAADQLCTLPWLGWIPDELTAFPAAAAAVGRLADVWVSAAASAQGCSVLWRLGRPHAARSSCTGARPARLARLGHRGPQAARSWPFRPTRGPIQVPADFHPYRHRR